MLALTSWENLHLRFLPSGTSAENTSSSERERVGAGNFCFLSKISELITPIPSDGVEIYGRAAHTNFQQHALPKTQKARSALSLLGISLINDRWQRAINKSMVRKQLRKKY
jgi:hypothetical protein